MIALDGHNIAIEHSSVKYMFDKPVVSRAKGGSRKGGVVLLRRSIVVSCFIRMLCYTTQLRSCSWSQARPTGCSNSIPLSIDIESYYFLVVDKLK